MKAPILFSEKQRFTQWWIWVILIAINGLFIYGIVQQVILKVPFGEKPMGNTGLLMVAGGMFLLTLMLFSSKLETEITNEGIAVRLTPFHLRFKVHKWEDLSKAYLREYSPILEYGGWGLRYSISGYGKAYNMSGKMGLQLEFPNGKKLLIGTQKPMEMSAVLEKIEALK